MKLYKVTEIANKYVHYIPDRRGLKALIKLSDASLSKIIAKVRIGHIATGRKFFIEQVDIDESTIKEVNR